jgi:lysophospholipase L1-like esterase
VSDNTVKLASPGPRSVMAKLILIAIVTLAGIGLGALAFEVAVRVAVPVSDFFYEFDPHVGTKGIPNKTGYAVRRGVFTTPVSMNSHGFRDREHGWSKPAGTRRVVVLGDSFVEALQVPFERSVTPLLEAKVGQAAGSVEFINLGLSGFGTGRQYLMLREYGLRYQPDLVVLFLVGNDISDNSRRLQGKPFLPYPLPAGDGTLARDERGQPRFSTFADQTSALGSIAAFLRNRSKGYRVVREAIDGSTAVNGLLYRVGLMSTPPEQVNRTTGDNFGFYEIYRQQPTPAWAEAWALTEGMLLATRDLAAAHGAPFVVVTVPAAWEVYPDQWQGILQRVPAMRDVAMDLELPSKRLGRFLAAHGIPNVSLLDEFRARARTSPALYVAGDAHWTADGHRLAADLLAAPVSGLIASKGGAVASADGQVRTR